MRLSFVGSVVLGRNGRGLLKSSVPPLDPGTYTIAYWCPGCARYSRGRTFYVQDPEQFVEPYRSQALLRVETTGSCPVTVPNGNKPPGQPRNVTWGMATACFGRPVVFPTPGCWRVTARVRDVSLTYAVDVLVR